MVENFTSNFLGCINPCNFGWQNLSFNQVNPAGLRLFEGAFPYEMGGECEECRIRFSLLKRKKLCNDCGLGYCNSCIKRLTGGQRQCRKCTILSHWPINRTEIASLRVRDLRYFLGTCKIPTNTCKEKQEMIDLVIVQLRIKHLSQPQNCHNQSFVDPASRNDPTSTTTRDDGIRVRPHTTTNQAFVATAAAPHENAQDAGIRVFASSCSQDCVSSGEQLSTNVENSDNSSSSSWSLLQSEEVQEDLSSPESLISSPLPADIPSDTLYPTLDSIVVEEFAPTDNTHRGEGPYNELPHVPSHPVSVHSVSTNSCDSKMISATNVVQLSSLETEDSIKALSVRQCKEILALNRVDFSGVWEKHELLNKVKMLWTDYKQRQEEKDLTEDQLCKICMDAVMDCVLLECGHIVSCTACGKQMSECPVCRQNVLRVVKTFRA